MRDDFIFGLSEDIRQGILNDIANVPESKRTIVPHGFNNNLHWQLGHILTITDAIMFRFLSGESRIHESYPAFFASGTKPAEWPESPPHWEVIVTQLHEQMKQIRQTFQGKLDEPAADSDNFLEAEDVGELMQFFLVHESIHAGMITAMLKVL